MEHLEDLLKHVPQRYANQLGQRWARAYEEFRERDHKNESYQTYNHNRRLYANKETLAYAQLLRTIEENKK